MHKKKLVPHGRMSFGLVEKGVLWSWRGVASLASFALHANQNDLCMLRKCGKKKKVPALA
jgi:hypothetical protein